MNDIEAMMVKQKQETMKISKRMFSTRSPIANWKVDLVDAMQNEGWQPKGDQGVLHMRSFADHISKATEEERTMQLERQLLKQLDFPDFSDREERIVDAHPQTFHWVLDRDKSQQIGAWSNFVEWLQSED